MPVPPVRPSVNSKRPFWLLVSPGWPATLIWSKSSSPEYSTKTPPFRLWRPLTQERLSEKVQIGPCDDDGYGPPSASWKLEIAIVGILSSISLPGNTYG